jgi:hypothetical protein
LEVTYPSSRILRHGYFGDFVSNSYRKSLCFKNHAISEEAILMLMSRWRGGEQVIHSETKELWWRARERNHVVSYLSNLDNNPATRRKKSHFTRALCSLGARKEESHVFKVRIILNSRTQALALSLFFLGCTNAKHMHANRSILDNAKQDGGAEEEQKRQRKKYLYPNVRR